MYNAILNSSSSGVINPFQFCFVCVYVCVCIDPSVISGVRGNARSQIPALIHAFRSVSFHVPSFRAKFRSASTCERWYRPRRCCDSRSRRCFTRGRRLKWDRAPRKLVLAIYSYSFLELLSFRFPSDYYEILQVSRFINIALMKTILGNN